VAARIVLLIGTRPEKLPTHTELARLGKSIDLLVRGKVLDLKKKLYDSNLGYKFSHTHDEAWAGQPRTTVNVHSLHGDHVGFATFHHNPDGTMHAFGVAVDDGHQRQGIASHMYSLAERLTGKKIVQSKTQTEEGAKLWSGNAKQPQFGKTELPGRTAAPTPQGGPGEPKAPSRAQNGRIPGRRTIQVGAGSLTKSCCMCGSQLIEKSRLACVCWRELSASAKLEKTETGYQFKLGTDWDEDAISALALELRNAKE
jgi:GNAT superfamily N-acetyltransferase